MGGILVAVRWPRSLPCCSCCYCSDGVHDGQESPKKEGSETSTNTTTTNHSDHHSSANDLCAAGDHSSADDVYSAISNANNNSHGSSIIHNNGTAWIHDALLIATSAVLQFSRPKMSIIDCCITQKVRRPKMSENHLSKFCRLIIRCDDFQASDLQLEASI